MNISDINNLYKKAFDTWGSGGWLMVPLAILSFFIYFTALELYFRLLLHPLLKKHSFTGGLLAFENNPNMSTKENIRNLSGQYEQIREQLLNKIKRRTRFLSIIIPVGPLMGLLGTVLGILNMFNGMIESQINRFDHVAGGINKALITTQTGLIIAIPAYFILTLVKQKRKKLELSIYQIEQGHIKYLLKNNSVNFIK